MGSGIKMHILFKGAGEEPSKLKAELEKNI